MSETGQEGKTRVAHSDTERDGATSVSKVRSCRYLTPEHPAYNSIVNTGQLTKNLVVHS